jgi:hypothetical protein
MDRRDHPAPARSHHPAGQLRVRCRLDWTRQSGTGPDPGILGPLAGRTVVELGCGSGHNLAHLIAAITRPASASTATPAKIRRADQLYGQLDRLRFVHDDDATHGLRHSHKTWMAEDGIPEILAGQRLATRSPAELPAAPARPATDTGRQAPSASASGRHREDDLPNSSQISGRSCRLP